MPGAVASRVRFGEALRWGNRLLSESSESSRADAALLLAHVARQTREWIVAHDDELLAPAQLSEFAAMCERRRSGLPVAYLLGSAGFYGREFLVNENVLVPRAETEHLVDEAVAFIRGPMRVLDVGTGCGAIACTIAAETNAAVDGTDISSDAIEIAKENARRLRVADRCRFHRGDLIDPVARDRFDVIVANLPYVPTPDLPQRPGAAFFEPREALDGGPDGLDLYRRLLLLLPALLNERTLLLLEAAPPTIPALADIVRSALPHVTIAIGRDYAGLARYVKAQAQVTNQCPPN